LFFSIINNKQQIFQQTWMILNIYYAKHNFNTLTIINILKF
jgi:hypothetical protein